MKNDKKAKKTTKTPEGRPVTKEFIFKLTEDEIKQKNAGAGALTLEIEDLKRQFTAVKKDWSEKIKFRMDSRLELSTTAIKQEEPRTVDAILVKDYASREIKYYFEGEVIESRTMTKEELQMEMDEFKESKRGKKQKIDTNQNLSGMSESPDEEIKSAIKAETNKKTKKSSVDPITTN